MDVSHHIKVEWLKCRSVSRVACDKKKVRPILLYFLSVDRLRRLMFKNCGDRKEIVEMDIRSYSTRQNKK